MSNFIGFGSSSPLILISFGPARLREPGAPQFAFGGGGDVLHLVGWGGGGELVRRDALPPDGGC